MNTLKYISTIVCTAALVACGGNPTDNITSMMNRNIDATLAPCTSGGWQGADYSKPRYYFADITGEPILGINGPTRYEVFSNGLLYVTHHSGEEEGNRFINADGETVIDLTEYGGSPAGHIGQAYSVFDRFTDGVAFVVADSIDNEKGLLFPKCLAINTKGDILFEVYGKPVTPMESGYFMVENDGNYFIVDNKGKAVIEATKGSELRLGKVCGSRRDMVEAYVNNEYAGLLEFATGKYLLSEIPNDAISNSGTVGIDWNDRAVFRQDGKYGLVDRKGNVVVEPTYDSLIIDGQWYLASDNGCATWINPDGKVMIETDYKYESYFDRFNNIVGFGTGSLCYVGDGTFIDRKGKEKLTTDYEAVTPFIDGKAIVKIQDGRQYAFAWMDEKGNLCSEPFPTNENFTGSVARWAMGLYVSPSDASYSS